MGENVNLDLNLTAGAQNVTSEWHPRPSDAGRSAAIAGIALGLLAFLAWLYIISQPVGAGTLVALLVGVSAAVLAAAMATFAFGYYSMRYSLNDEQLVLSCLWLHEVIPLGRVDGVGSGRRIGSRARVEGLAWRGLSIGRLNRTDLDSPTVFATSLVPEATLAVTVPGRSYVLNPADRDAFRSDLIARLESLSDDQIESAPEPSGHGSILPFTSVAADRVCLMLGAGTLVALLVSFAYVALKLPGLPDVIPLHFNAAGMPDFVVSRTDAFRLPFIGTLLLGVNTVVVAVVYSWERNAGRITAAATLFIELVALMSLLRVVQ